MNLGPIGYLLKYACSERLNKYSECVSVSGSYILMLLDSWMQWLVMIWAKMLLTKKWWRRSAMFLYSNYNFVSKWIAICFDMFIVLIFNKTCLVPWDTRTTHTVIASYSPTGHKFHIGLCPCYSNLSVLW